MSLFSRARAYLNLAPGERALLKLADLCLIAGLVAALPVVADALGRQPVNWQVVGQAALAAFSVAALAALLKYLKAQLDPPLVPVTPAVPAVPAVPTPAPPLEPAPAVPAPVTPPAA